MAFEADHKRAAISQECAIVLRRADCDSLGWLTSLLGQLYNGAGGALVGSCPQRACFACCVLLFGASSVERPRESNRDSELAQAKTSLYS
jgi:hypothetical protein